MSKMKFNELPFRTALNLGIALMTLSPMAAAQGDGLYQQYCSNENTGSGFSAPVSSIYMSNGKCQTICSGYAFGVVQYKTCWCTNYIPSAQDNTSQCNVHCPGFPSDSCGNEGQGLYGYIPLGPKPAGTAGASSAKPQSSAPPTSVPAPSAPASSAPSPDSSSIPQSSSSPPSSSIPQYSSSSAAPLSSSSSPTTNAHHRTHTHTHTHTNGAHMTVQVVTKSGKVVTQTVTSTPVVISGGGNMPDNSKIERKGFSSGAVAGIVIGVLAGVAALALAAFFLWRRKKNANPDGEAGGPTKTRPKRSISVLSKTGLLARSGTGKERPQSMAENYDDNNFNGGNSVRHSMMFGAGAAAEGVSPSSPLGGSQDNTSASSRRHSKPMVYDQRLNPSALFANAEANGSRVSMQDQQDYSRPLGIANPDFRPSFDSR